MKKIIVFAWLMLSWITWVNADYKVFDNQLDFEKSMWAVCEAATDWCNSYFMQDWKVAWWTLMYCEWKKVEWTCTKYKEWVMTTKSINLDDSISWIITKIENWKDWIQAYIKWNDNKEYSTAISIISDKISNWKYSDIKIWAKIKIQYTDKSWNILIWDNIEILKKQKLSDNDYNLYKNIKDKLEKNKLEEHNKTTQNYIKKLEKISSDKNILNKKVVNTLDKYISDFLLKFPQDKPLSSKNSEIYQKLVFLKLELEQLEF